MQTLDQMTGGKNGDLEELLNQAFFNGYSNATSSLSKMLMQKAGFSNLYRALLRIDDNRINNIEDLNRKGPMTMITTEIFGDVTGKSYLLLSRTELDFMTSGIPVPEEGWANLKVEFIKEVDNILSAAVISRLSDRLNLSIYGDTPILTQNSVFDMGSLISKDFSEQSEAIYISASSFFFEDQARINPFFIWVVDSRIVKLIPEV